MGKVAAVALGALLSLGVCGAASAQGTAQPTKQGLETMVKGAINKADEEIKGLEKLSPNDKETVDKRDAAVTDLKNLHTKLEADLKDIRHATPKDLKTLSDRVVSDLHDAKDESKKVAEIMKPSSTGVANPQPKP
jgi:hypothetical protein